jgi:hypothetical protein
VFLVAVPSYVIYNIGQSLAVKMSICMFLEFLIDGIVLGSSTNRRRPFRGAPQEYDRAAMTTTADKSFDAAQGKPKGGARRHRRHVVGDLLPRRRSWRARLLRLRHSRSRAARHVRRGLLPSLASAAADAGRAR